MVGLHFSLRKGSGGDGGDVFAQGGRATATLAESPKKSQILTDVPSSCACRGAMLTVYENQTRCQCSSALKENKVC